MRVLALEEPRWVARGASPWNANGRAAKPWRGDRTLEARARRGWPNPTAGVWRIGGRCPSHAYRSLPALRNFVVR